MKSNQAVLDSFRDCCNRYHEWTADSWISLEAPFWIPAIVTCSLQATKKRPGVLFPANGTFESGEMFQPPEKFRILNPLRHDPENENHDNL